VKETFLPLILSSLLLLAASWAAALERGTVEVQSASSIQLPMQGHYGWGTTRRVERLAKQLNLTSHQQAKVQGILEQQQGSMQNLRQDSSLSQQDRRAKMTDIHSAIETQFRALLAGNQQQKWDQMQKNRQQHGREHYQSSASDDDDSSRSDQT
jgi:periplasmic protein CpxP/Spy